MYATGCLYFIVAISFLKGSSSETIFRGTVFGSNGNSGNSVNYCSNRDCRTCINNKCYNRNFEGVMATPQCEIAACDVGCNGFVWNTDNCPICRCNGFSTREPCSSNADCKLPNGQCTQSLCRYPAVPDNLPKVCVFTNQCPESENCNAQRCQADPTGRRHVVGQNCVFPFQCPEGFGNCNAMTCFEGPGGGNGGGFGPVGTPGNDGGGVSSRHLPSGSGCVFDWQCPTKYSCQQMTCFYSGVDHGTTSCSLPWQCPAGQSCINMTCQ